MSNTLTLAITSVSSDKDPINFVNMLFTLKVNYRALVSRDRRARFALEQYTDGNKKSYCCHRSPFTRYLRFSVSIIIHLFDSLSSPIHHSPNIKVVLNSLDNYDSNNLTFLRYENWVASDSLNAITAMLRYVIMLCCYFVFTVQSAGSRLDDEHKSATILPAIVAVIGIYMLLLNILF